MNSYSVIIGQMAGILVVISYIPYIRSIVQGKTKPERATRAIWAVVAIVIFLSYVASGARETAWVAFMYAIFNIIILILSFKYGVGGSNKLDIICLLGATIGVFLWIVTKNPLTAFYASIFVEILGFIPTLKKTYLYPKTENTLAWVIGTCAALLNLFAITNFKPEIVTYPVYLFLSDGIIAFLTLFPKIRYKFKKTL